MRVVLLITGALVLAACGSGHAGSMDNAVSAIEAPVPPHAGSRYLYELNDVACASARGCVATGVLNTRPFAAHGLLLAERQGTWTVTEPPLPRNLGPGTKRRVAVGSVSCPAVGRCVAVGDASSGAQDEPLVFTQRGSGWHEAVVPLPAGAKAGALGLVSCPSAGDCSAAGSYADAAGLTRAFLVTERGGTWGRPIAAAIPANALTHPDPNFGLEAAEIDSLSCASPGNCAAVGIYTDTEGSPEGLLLTENGGEWAQGVEATLPENAEAAGRSYVFPVTGLRSVSCASVTDCAAVGGYLGHHANQFGMILTEHAGRWATGTETPLPANAGPNPQVGNLPESPMGSIACPSPGNCSAVGSYREKSGKGRGLLLAEHAGRWTPSEAVLPPDAGGNVDTGLYALSCPSTGNCVVAGSYSTAAGATRMLFVTERNGRWADGVGVPLPAGANQLSGGYVTSISCPSPSYCLAVGSYSDKTGAMQGMIVTIRPRQLRVPAPGAAPRSGGR